MSRRLDAAAAVVEAAAAVALADWDVASAAARVRFASRDPARSFRVLRTDFMLFFWRSPTFFMSLFLCLRAFFCLRRIDRFDMVPP
jgi:hypothetical protein